MFIDVKDLLKAISDFKPNSPMDLIHIGQRQMAMILDYIHRL